MKKHLLTVLLAVCLVLALGTVSALAVDTALPDPVGDVITLTDNVVLSRGVTIASGDEIAIDLNGYSITLSDDSSSTLVFNVMENATLTIDDSVGGGRVYAPHTVIQVRNSGTLVINGGIIDNTNTDYNDAGFTITNFGNIEMNGGTVQGISAIIVQDPGRTLQAWAGGTARFDMNGGEVIGIPAVTANDDGYIGASYGVNLIGPGLTNSDVTSVDNSKVFVNINGGTIRAIQGICTNASSGAYAGFTLNVTGGTINGTDEGTAMYLPGMGKTTISGGTVTGAQGIRIASGELEITCGEIISTAGGDVEDIIAGGSGGTNGALVIGKAGTGYVGDLIVNVSGTATIKNTSGEDNPTAIFVTDKTMENDAYADTVIEVNVEEASIEGNVVRASNLSGSGTDNKSDTTTLTIDSATVAGDVINQSKNGGVTVNDSVVNGAVTVSGGNGTIAVLNSSVESKNGIGIILVNTSVGDSEPTTDVGGNVAIVDGVGYTTLASAIAAADSGDTVTLVGNVNETINLVITDKNLTIEGNGQSITTEVGGGATSIGVQLVRSSLTLNDVDWTFTPNTNGGTAIDVQNNGSELTLNNSTVTINGTKRGMVMSATADSDENLAKINILNGSVLNVSNLSGNGSNGGAWTVTDSTINMNGIGNHALSVDTLTVTDSRLIFDDIGYAALYGENIVLNDGADVQINNAGNALPFQSTWDPTITYNYPVELKNADSSMEIKTGAQITITNCENLNNEVNNTIYIPEGGDFTSNGTVTATVELGDANMNLVTVINRDSTTMLLVADGGTYKLDNPGTYNGYEFRGWRDNSGKLHKAGDVVTVNSDMTFTAVWSAIDIPDTYDIEIADTANGSVDTSLSNASAGSTITITATPDSGYSVASVTVTGPDGRVEVTRVNATTYTFKMPAGDVTVRVTFTDSDALPFTDVSAGQWFYDAVAYVYTNGMMEGDSATTFNPDGTMTRAMFWAVLGRIDGATITGTNWAEQARDWAMAEGVSDGTDPNGLVTREQMVTMLWRYAGEPESSASLSAYTDADSVSDWAETAMRWAIDEGIITGMTDTTLVPQGTATRAQCAAIFMRFDQM